MRGKRSKQYRKLMHQYELTFGFREPYQVLVDEEIVLEAVKTRYKLVEGLKRGIVRNLQELFKELTQEDIEAWLRIYRTIIRRSTQQQAAKE